MGASCSVTGPAWAGMGEEGRGKGWGEVVGMGGGGLGGRRDEGPNWNFEIANRQVIVCRECDVS